MAADQKVPPCFVLTAPHATESRRSNASQQLAAAGLTFSFVTGFAPDNPEVSRHYSRWRNLLFMKRSLTPGEVAVYLGHRKIWQAIIESGASAGLVFEDDFQFIDPGHAASIIGSAAQRLGQWDLIKLFDFRPHKPLATFPGDGFELALYKRPNSGLVGYMLTRDCCSKLAARRHVFRPVDEELRYGFQKRLRIATVEPNLVVDAGDALDGSLLEAGRLSLRASRNILRSIYGNVLTAYVNVCSEVWSRWVLWTLRT